MGIINFFENRLRRKKKKIATKSARIMLMTANLNKEASQKPHEVAKLAIKVGLGVPLRVRIVNILISKR